jgi:sortase A
MYRRSDPRRLVRLAGALLMVAGAVSVVWALVVWRWQDPFTAVYTAYEQHELSSRYDKRLATYRPPPVGARPAQTRVAPHRAALAAEQREIDAAAWAYGKALGPGGPLGRIKVPRLGLNAVLVTGTDRDSLTKGPGWDTRTFLPGQGQLVYIAGHRTTYSAPFAHIDALRAGDLVTIEVPYGTFTYVIRSHTIVPADDLAVLRSHDREVVALQACHPRFFATHRYIGYAVPARVVPRVGRPYSLASRHLAAASRS